MGNTSAYDALATPECGHTTDVVFPSLDMEAVITVLKHSVKACIPIKSHQLIITPIIVTIFSSMRCERYDTSKDPILEE